MFCKHVFFLTKTNKTPSQTTTMTKIKKLTKDKNPAKHKAQQQKQHLKHHDETFSSDFYSNQTLFNLKTDQMIQNIFKNNKRKQNKALKTNVNISPCRNRKWAMQSDPEELKRKNKEVIYIKHLKSA